MTGSRGLARRLAVAGALLLLAAPFVRPLAEAGWIQTHEGLSYPIRVAQLLRCWQDGMWSARWFPDLNQGAGYPFLSFYAPLYFVLAGLAASAGAGLAFAAKVPTILAALLAAAGAYRLARLGLDRAAAFACAALFVHAPYLVRDVYIRGDLAEHLALALLPWSLAGVLRLARSHAPRDVVLAAVAASLPILTHNITGMLGAAWLAAAGIVAVRIAANRPAAAVAVATAGLAALLLTAFFWAPALSERAYVRTDAMLEGAYDVARNFLPPLRLLGPPATVPPGGQELPMSFEPAYVALALGLAALAARRPVPAPARPLLALGAILFVASTLMTMRIAEPVYAALPLLRFVQFPWRFLGPAALGLALLGGVAFASLLGRAAPRVRASLAAAAAAVAVLLVAPVTGPKPPIPIPDWAVDGDSLAKQRVTTSGCDEYLPRWVEERPNPRAFRDGVALLGEGTVVSSRRGAGRWDLTIEAPAPVRVVLCDAYYPGWAARLDGAPHPVAPRARHGDLVLDIPAGRHDVAVRLGPTPLRLATRIISVVTALVALAVVLGSGRSPQRDPDGSAG